MRRKELAALEALTHGLAIPATGMTLLAFASALKLDPRDAIDAGRFLHRKGRVWISERKGHVRIYSKSPKSGRGRPPAGKLHQPRLIDEDLAALLAEAHPTFLCMKLLRRQMPEGGWRARPELRAEIVHSLAVEASNVMGVCRRYAAKHRACSAAAIRDALWLDQPEMMALVCETQPDLARDNTKPFSDPLQIQRRKLPANLPDDERVLSYIRNAGRNGIAAYEIANKFGGKLSREQVEDIGTRYENMGTIISAVVRPAGRGRKGVRYFWAELGEPNVNADGRLILQ